MKTEKNNSVENNIENVENIENKHEVKDINIYEEVKRLLIEKNYKKPIHYYIKNNSDLIVSIILELKYGKEKK